MSSVAPAAEASRSACEDLVGELAQPRGRHRDEVRAAQPVEPVLGDDLHAAGGGDRLAGAHAADPEVEERDAVVGAVHAEDLAQHAELEDRELVEDEDGDAAQHAVSVLAESLTKDVFSATVGRNWPSGDFLP